MKWVGARIAVPARCSSSSASQSRAASAPNSSCGTSRTSPNPRTASAARPCCRAFTARLRPGSRWRRISSISAMGMPASCRARNGSPAPTARSWPRSPTSTSRATRRRSEIRIRSCICAVDVIDDSSSTSTEPSCSRLSVRHLPRIAEVAVARQEPLHGAHPGAGLVGQHPGRRSRRREQDRLPLADQIQHLAQHRRLARLLPRPAPRRCGRATAGSCAPPPSAPR